MRDEVTIIVAPRDHFAHAQRSLESLLANTSRRHPIIYVDHSAPREVGAWLRETCAAHGIRRLQVDRPLSPNQARNLALQQVRTPWVALVDNDVELSPGWLEALLGTAVRRDAWLVGPLLLEPPAGDPRIHMAGGNVGFGDEHGQRLFKEIHHLAGVRLRDAPVPDEAQPTHLVEFHCLLARSAALERLGPLDPALLSHLEHVDLCLEVARAGGGIYLEPRSRVMLHLAHRDGPDDHAYYLLRWSDAWNRASLEHFASKWRVAAGDPYREHALRYTTGVRRRALGRVAWPLGRMLELGVYRRGLRRVFEPVVRWLERASIQSHSKPPGARSGAT